MFEKLWKAGTVVPMGTNWTGVWGSLQGAQAALWPHVLLHKETKVLFGEGLRGRGVSLFLSPAPLHT